MRSSGSDLVAQAQVALAEFDAGETLSIAPLPAGSRTACKVRTTQGMFVLKPAYRVADVELQAEVAELLNVRGIRQPLVLRARSGEVVTSSGYFLQQFLAGSASEQPTPAQIAAAMRHVGRYHRVLGQLPVAYQPDADSLWVRVADPDFLVNALPGLLARYGMADAATHAALDFLYESRAGLAVLPRQVVHGDIGPDNVLMDADTVVALIDFTPHLQSVLFAASSALYWYHVYGRQPVATSSLRTSVEAIGAERQWTDAELSVWPAGLVAEALRRLATTLELARRSGARPGPSTGPRLAAVRGVAGVLPALLADRR